MASNTFGNHFKITTWGESHGSAIGVVIDGCPSNIEINEGMILEALKQRRPGLSPYTSSRNEKDVPKILSGVFEGKTTGAPILIMIENQDVDSSSYETIKHILKPGHANYCYLQKYGLFDYRGGGRASARETACRVAAGAIAKAILKRFGFSSAAYLKDMGPITSEPFFDLEVIENKKSKSAVFCPDLSADNKMRALIEELKSEGDSVGGVVAYLATGVPVGLGDPIYEKIEANLAKAMLSIPGTKGFEIGEGFNASRMRGSQHNDCFKIEKGSVKLQTNHAGGSLGGITTGAPIWFKVAFKPTSSIKKEQKSVNIHRKEESILTPAHARHDPCIAIRGVAVVDAMASLVFVDALLMNQIANISNFEKVYHDT